MANKKDYRFHVANKFVDSGEIKFFSDIFKIIPKTIMAKELGTNNNRMTNLIQNPLKFTLEELEDIADAIDSDLLQMVTLIIEENHKKTSQK